ncbi:MAG: phosphatase PAP2 family protein [Actinobacteria bacterium]|nr:phosphatase PAP2 family protein [Actinomycetota bacterium]
MSARTIRERLRARSWRAEVLLFVGAYVAYALTRGASSSSLERVRENASLIEDVQGRLGIGVERVVQEHLVGLPLMWLVNGLYLVAQFAVLPAILVWVYRRRPDVYPRLRTTVLAAWLIALPVYALFPTAPPWLADTGMLDTVRAEGSFALDSPFVAAFYNPAVAVPSLYAGSAFAIGIGVASSTSRWWVKLVALSWGPAISLVVVATGNQFVLDVVVGLVAVLLGYSAALFVHRASPGRGAPSASRWAAEEYALPCPGASLRLAIVCPYDWEVPGGVRTHVEGLGRALRARGHSVDILAAGRVGSSRPGVALMGAPRPLRINGSMARIALAIGSAGRVARELRRGGYDPNGIDPVRPPRSAVTSVRRSEGGRIVFIGRHEPRKGLDVLLRAFSDLPVTTHLDLVGVRPEEIDGADLSAETRRRIHPRGRVSDEGRQRFLRRADVLCAPSIGGESFGLVLVEAMAHGVPVVASEIPGYRDVLPTGCGLLVPPGDHVALALALTSVLGDPALRTRIRDGAKSAVAPFEWPRVAALIEDRYFEAMALSGHRRALAPSIRSARAAS